MMVAATSRQTVLLAETCHWYHFMWCGFKGCHGNQEEFHAIFVTRELSLTPNRHHCCFHGYCKEFKNKAT